MKKIKLAMVLPYEWFGHQDAKRWNLPLYHFIFKGFDQNKRVEVTRFVLPITKTVVSNLTGFDAVFKFSPWRANAPRVEGMDKLKCVKFCMAGDFHAMNQEWKDSYTQEGYDFCWYHTAKKQAYAKKIFLPEDNVDYRTIMPGVDIDIYGCPSFGPRVKDKILASGGFGGKGNFYRLRNISRRDPNVVSFSKTKHRGLKYPILLGKFRAAIASVTAYTAIRYIEIPMCGCLTFMEGTYKNYWKHLNFTDNENAIRIDATNYVQKFREYIETVDDPKWEKIAAAGRKHAIKHWSNRVQVNKLIDIIEEFL